MINSFKKYTWFFKLRWKSYTFGVLALIICAILQVLNPKIIGTIIDGFIAGTLTWQTLLFWTALILISSLAMYALRYGWRMALFGNSTLIESILRNRLFSFFTRMDSEFFQKYRTGDLMAHATNDLAAIRFVAADGVLTLTDAISLGGITLFSMFFFIDWKLTLFAILPLPILIIVSTYLGKQIHSRYRGALKSFSSMNDHVQESVTGMKVLKTLGEEKEDLSAFKKNTQKVVAENQRVYKLKAALNPSIEIIMGATYVIALLVGGNYVQIGRISIGDLVAFISYIGMMQWPLLAVGGLINTLERGSAAYDRVEALLAYTPAIVEVESPYHQALNGDITFDIQSFTYPGAAQPTLTDVSFHLEEGKMLGVVGRTGSGKSTLYKLLLRDYDQYEGRISYGDIDIKEYALQSLKEGMAIVPQENFLFSTTIRENIRFGNPQLSQEEVEKYAKLANVHEDILSFPEGYDTEVGERGVSLSGGQKQRIAIARALAVGPECLILDDSLSAVDAQTEEAILESLKQERRHKTTIISAHRISSIMHADEIIVMEKGNIVERGTHQQLIAMNGWYADMYQKQQLEKKLDGEAV
ncbi:abc transporter [Trichococcus palustris]|jgi:ATP-binding cassette, subfamily B, multidrug efflux pump|uniref:Abc transporter n=1 Tax=Trichococcus palustris TaxID=140314 RepID=A0A143YG52_9LACT|nr:ABC transporter transmembrane domain-containing protein [Trichococcus palustris]CZQ89891.1 abc transporter [Trichococcus palustris]SFK98725.1 ATP-binding cassette, subfamily B [Trichococcus palustris]